MTYGAVCHLFTIKYLKFYICTLLKNSILKKLLSTKKKEANFLSRANYRDVGSCCISHIKTVNHYSREKQFIVKEVRSLSIFKDSWYSDGTKYLNRIDLYVSLVSPHKFLFKSREINKIMYVIIWYCTFIHFVFSFNVCTLICMIIKKVNLK